MRQFPPEALGGQSWGCDSSPGWPGLQTALHSRASRALPPLLAGAASGRSIPEAGAGARRGCPETVSAEARACHRGRGPSGEMRKAAGAGTGACAAAEDERDGDRQTPGSGTSSDQSPQERFGWRSRSPQALHRHPRGPGEREAGSPSLRGLRGGQPTPTVSSRVPRTGTTRRPRMSPASGSSWPARPARARAPPAPCGNALGRTRFPSRLAAAAVTRACALGSRRWGRRRLEVTDTSDPFGVEGGRADPDCAGRVCALDNRAAAAERRARVDELPARVERLVREHAGAPFPNAEYRLAGTLRHAPPDDRLRQVARRLATGPWGRERGRRRLEKARAQGAAGAPAAGGCAAAGLRLPRPDQRPCRRSVPT